VTLNYGEAMHWYKAAAAQGHAKAMYDIGTLFENGQGVERSMPDAARWYRDAAERHEPAAAHSFAILYETGQGVEPDKVEAWVWFSIAAEKEFPGASQSREALGAQLSTPEMERARQLLAQRTA